MPQDENNSVTSPSSSPPRAGIPEHFKPCRRRSPHLRRCGEEVSPLRLQKPGAISPCYALFSRKMLLRRLQAPGRATPGTPTSPSFSAPPSPAAPALLQPRGEVPPGSVSADPRR